MNITLFTSDKKRHKYFINQLSNISKNLFVVQEYYKNESKENFIKSSKDQAINKYFNNVKDAEIKIFGESEINNFNKNVKILKILFGELSNCSLSKLSSYLNSDLYIVFGSSYIKGDLIDFLIKNKAINIHMGVSPFYRGTDCNFWALYDNNPHLVGSTIRLLSKGLDDGPILYHSMSSVKKNPFEYTMSTVKSAFNSLIDKINKKSIFKIKPEIQNQRKEIRYSRSNEFVEEIVIDYFKKKIDINSKNFNNSLLKEPFFLKEL